MDFTRLRPLFYRDRNTLDDFNYLDDEDSKIEPFLYDRLIEIDYLHPKNNYSNEEILRIFNDVFYFLTLFFWDKNPLAHYADYQRIANPDNGTDIRSENRLWVELSMIYVILNRFNKAKWFKNMKSHAKFFDLIKEEIVKRKHPDYFILPTISHRENDSKLIVSTITTESEDRFFFLDINRDFVLRNILEIIEGDESLQECLLAGEDLREVVNLLCTQNEQKLALIDRLLEPEKKGYGFLDIKIRESYHCLYELRSELTGEPLPDMPPFERFAKALGPPMISPYSQDIVEDYSDSESDSSQTMIDLQTRIAELEEQVEHYHNMEKGIALGLNQGQSSLLVKSMAKTFGFTYTNMKKDLAPLAHGMFGWGESKLAKYMSTPCEKNERDELANLFKDVCPQLYSTIMNWGELPPEETPA